MLTIQFLCPLPNGLHARPAWELKEQCSQWQSEITFINHRQNAKADAKSSLALIGTGTLFNDSCSLNISGSDEEQARRVLEDDARAAGLLVLFLYQAHRQARRVPAPRLGRGL